MINLAIRNQKVMQVFSYNYSGMAKRNVMGYEMVMAGKL